MLYETYFGEIATKWGGHYEFQEPFIPLMYLFQPALIIFFESFKMTKYTANKSASGYLLLASEINASYSSLIYLH